MSQSTRTSQQAGADAAYRLPELFTLINSLVNIPDRIIPQISDILSAATVVNYRLGELIIDNTLPNSPEASVQTEQNRKDCPDLYWVYQGRVRLLSQSRFSQREVTVQVLEVEETFGAETTLHLGSLSYRAIAASPVTLIRLPASSLIALLELLPALRQSLLNAVRQRERLIFFKTQTALYSCPNQQLKLLLPYLTEQQIPIGNTLVSWSTNQPGRVWLKQGQIGGEPTCSLMIGDSWSHLDPLLAGAVSLTDLQVEFLPVEVWETVSSIVPALSKLYAQTAAVPHPPLQPPPARRTIAPVHWIEESAAMPQPVPIAEPNQAQVAFPKPLRRRFLDAVERYPWVGQQSSSDCGVACLAMISRYWGKQFPLHVLREWANVGRAGASLKSLAKAAEGLGFHARPVRASLSRLIEQPNPWIAHWQGNHFVVVYQIKGNRVFLADPALGRRVVARREFQNHWTGYALLLDPTTKLQQTEIKQTTLSRYFGALLPYRSLTLQIILVSLLIQIFGLVTPLFTQIILDKVVVQKSLPTLNVFAVGLLLFGIWSIGMGSVRQYLLSYFSNRLDLTLISGFIRHALLLPLKFFESRRVGDIITRVQENQKIQRFLIGQVMLAWLDLLTGVVYLGLMLYYNWRLTLLVLLLIPPLVILTLAATPILRRISREIFKTTMDQNSTLVEIISGVSTLKAAAAEQELRWRWEDQLTDQMNTVFRGQKLGIGLQVASGLIRTIGSTALLWYGARLVIQDQLTIGQFVAFNMMMGYVISPVLTLVNLWDELQEVLISVERLNDIFEAQPELTEHTGLILPPIRGEVQFENVTFRYNEDEERNVLQNLAFVAHPGETIAIVGRSGSGKSTLIKLLEGLYRSNQGRVWIDGHDIRHVSPQSLRSQIGVVPQECFLFSGTILENITLYRPEFTLEQVIEVAKLAEAHSFVQTLPLGYHTKVGERGSTLSGGQRQRIAIARALLGNPRILILDEATSALDTEAERRFQRNLAQISRDRTTFIIAHRLSTVHNANRILVLDQGVLVEQGNHAELMAQRGLYYHLAQQQLDL